MKCTLEIYMIIIRNKTNIEILGVVIINYTNENYTLNFVEFTPAFWLHNNLTELTALKHEFKGWFGTQKPVLKVCFKDLWFTKINPTQIWYDKYN